MLDRSSDSQNKLREKMRQKIFVHKRINYIYVLLALFKDLMDEWHTQPKI